MQPAIDEKSLAVMLRDARTYNGWQKKPVPHEVLRAIYDDMKWGPTSANCTPLRIAFVESKEAKEKLKPCLQAGNVDKTMAAPVTAIIAQDMEFYELLPRLYPHADARSWFAGKPDAIADTATRNAVLQAGYFILTARAWGLDCGPMSGFDKKKCDEAFFADGRFKSNFLINLGYGDKASLYPRGPRLAFDEVCKVL